MAKKATTKPRAKAEVKAPEGTCKDCKHSYDWQNRSFHDGHFILCRCPFQEWCKFLERDRCGHFEKR